MSFWRQLTHGFRGLMRHTERNEEVGEEAEHYFEEATAVWKSRGLSDEDAKRAARLELGNRFR
jgi:hypothetical protein